MEILKHECGIAMVRLLKPLNYYEEKYGTSQYGLNKLYLLMEKQHNRGQEGAGIGCVNLKARPGNEYVYRERGLGSGAISEIFDNARKRIIAAQESNEDTNNLPFLGEIYMGHLRYSTTGKHGISYVHPFLRRNNWKSRNLLLCGNFNITNVEEVFSKVVEEGQHPRIYSDTVILLEQIGYYLDKENQRLYDKFKAEGFDGVALTNKIEDNIDIANVIKEPSKTWDGGFVICGADGSGDIFILRDPNGIRPCFYYLDDEVFVAASERPVIQTAMNVRIGDIKELEPGEAIMVSKHGKVTIKQILPKLDNQKCSFERIYFSRGSDADIYKERKLLGKNLTEKILKAVDYDLDNTILSFIPNTAEVAYIGMCEGVDEYEKELQCKEILKLDSHAPGFPDKIKEILNKRVRKEKIAIKDIKLRTFIAEGKSRNELAAHVYDVTYGQVKNDVDNLVIIDDSIVRGTTLKQSIVRILDRLHPKRIVVVSSSPQVRYPDYYGIDMSRMAEFCAFRAAIALIQERGMGELITSTYKKCKAQEDWKKEDVVNYVKEIYAPFTDEEISDKIAEMITGPEIKAEVKLVYQSIEGLHNAIPNHPGDWYFSGNYPTPGGNKMVNQAFINWYEGNPDKR
ncbi:MAG: amidophosphoribosyltransferase [Sodaliphilus sp.]|nr:amidophosphoribosyltransferase [Muribaculaceae bacterium]MCI6224384.1 amidophosphoribosyltransferase [Bacteroidales bacterium]MDY2592584.1 amidophosphoribosyltransferase [Sodaliphilus sp.]MCI6293068.1 amidophosphoribosyltransferase [Bacteroidales bacterium]MCI6562607.1 amidophosphoribosyltransferase [Bacteroidales bacterium]